MATNARGRNTNPPGRAARLALGLLATGLLALAGCGKSSPDAGAPATGGAATGAPTGTLNFYNWNNYIDPATVQRFEQKFNARIVQTYYSDNDEMLAKLAAGATGYDVIVPTANAVEVMIAQGDLMPLDHAQLPNLKNIRPEFTGAAFDPEQKYSVPYTYSVTVLAYNDKALAKAGFAAPVGWEAVFDPAIACKLKGKITVLDSPDEVFSAAFYDLGIDPNTHSLDDYKKAADLIRKAKPCWAAFNSSSYIKEMAAGEIWLALGYSSDFFQANLSAQQAKQGFNIVSVLPSQGATLGLDNLVILKSAPNPRLAHAFLNFMMEGQNSADLSNLIGSGNAYSSGLEFIKPEIKANQTVFPPADRMKLLHVLRMLPPELRQERSRLWTELKL